MDVAQRWRRKKKARTAAAAAAGRTLPDDVVLEILGRVADAADVVTLFRCATACKRWRGLVSDPSFLRGRHRPDPSPSHLLGFFAQQRPYRPRTVSADPLPGNRSPAFVPAPRSPLGPGRRSLGSFLSCATAAEGSLFDLDDAEPLVSRHGLLLVRLRPRSNGATPTDDVGRDRTLVHLAVCNLLVGTCDMLPPLKCKASSKINSCTIVTDADSCESSSPSPWFKVLILVYNRPSTYYKLCTFSSAEWSWSTPPAKCFSGEHLGVANVGVVVCQGTASWLVTDGWGYFCTLDVRAEEGGHVLTELPLPQADHHDSDATPLLSVAMDGTMSLLLLDADYEWVETWTLQGYRDGSSDDGGAAYWLRTRVTELNLPDWSFPQRFYVGERSGTFIVTDTDQHGYVVDLETGEMDEVKNGFRSLHLGGAVVPFEMDWPAFFLSRLEGPPAKVRENL